MRPLLAATIGDITRDVVFPCFASFKVDGVRALAWDGAAMSRSMKPLPNREVQQMFCNKELYGLDGELVVGDVNAKDVFNVTTSTVMTRVKPVFDDLIYYVFDDFDAGGQYAERFAHMCSRVNLLALPWIRPLAQTLHTTVDSLLAHEEEALREGYEGLMVRSPRGYYKQGRSTLNEQYLMKLKRFTDTEAECVGFTELRHNANEPTVSETGYQVRSSHKSNMIGGGTLGALTCVWEPTGETFNIGTGFSAQDRQQLWNFRESLPGRIVKFKYQPYGVKDLPRLPVFIGFRAKEDM